MFTKLVLRLFKAGWTELCPLPNKWRFVKGHNNCEINWNTMEAKFWIEK